MTDYIKAQIQVQLLLAQAAKLEAASCGMEGSPYTTEEEEDYHRQWHLDHAERCEQLANELIEENT